MDTSHHALICLEKEISRVLGLFQICLEKEIIKVLGLFQILIVNRFSPLINFAKKFIIGTSVIFKYISGKAH